jgi:hypothetical protein
LVKGYWWLAATTFNNMTLSITTLCIMSLLETLSINVTQLKTTLSLAISSAIMPSVVTPSVVMLRVVAPGGGCGASAAISNLKMVRDTEETNEVFKR